MHLLVVGTAQSVGLWAVGFGPASQMQADEPSRLSAAWLRPSLHLSDHRLLAVSLRPKVPPPEHRQEQRWRVRIHFSGDPALHGEFLTAAGALAATAPPHPAQLVYWWEGFKQDIFHLCQRLNKTHRAQHHHRCEGATAALAEAYSRADGGAAGAIANVQSARARLSTAEAAERATSALSARRAWLHDNERASPALTARLRAPIAPIVPALRTPAGGLVTTARGCADTLADHWAGVSAAQATDAGAQEAVLAALDAAPQVSPVAAADLSAPSVAVSEVARALRRARPGTSPGPDGLPVEVYRRFSSVFLLLLARVFQAILQEAFLPPHFQDGLIVFLSKPGDASNPANYRPITLLNTDYRCFARLLALRLGRALAPVIDPQQTAFLPGRSIAENLLLLQLLPHALCAEQRSALAVFCDVRKAYDTVDRAFLWKVMGRLGVEGPFLRAAQALLSHTWARSCVRSAMSRSVSFSAGVRQGCPLAPLLCLFVGQALGRFLATVGVGLHPGKSQAMLLGSRTLPPMIPQAPVRLVRTAEALGVTFHEGVGTPTVDWQAQVAAVLHRL